MNITMEGDLAEISPENKKEKIVEDIAEILSKKYNMPERWQMSQEFLPPDLWIEYEDFLKNFKNDVRNLIYR